MKVRMKNQHFKTLLLALAAFALTACVALAPKPSPGFVLSDYRALRQPSGSNPVVCAHRYALRSDNKDVPSAGIRYRIKSDDGQIVEGVTDEKSETAVFQGACGTRISLYLATTGISWIKPETAP